MGEEKFVKFCPNCNSLNKLNNNFCVYCGVKFQEDVNKIKLKKGYGIYLGTQSKYHNEFKKLDKLGGISYLNSKMENQTPKEIAKELFNFDNDYIIHRYYKLHEESEPKVKRTKLLKDKNQEDNLKTKQCPNCGENVKKVRNHCPKCGYEFYKRHNQSNNENADELKSKNSNKSEKENGNKINQEISFKKCPHCNRHFKGQEICPFCGYNFETKKIPKKEIICPNCGNAQDESHTKCGLCGFDFKNRNRNDLNSKSCPRCGKTIMNGATRCQNCAYKFKSNNNKRNNRRDDDFYHHSQSQGHDSHDMSPWEIEQAMEGGMSSDTDAGTIEQINEILYDDDDEMW